jgi:hypothetical protein
MVPPTLLQQQLDGGRAARAYLHVGVRTWGHPYVVGALVSKTSSGLWHYRARCQLGHA